jgi:hypothetical protein
MKSRFRRTDNWRKGLVSDFSPLFWSGSVEYCRRPLAERASAKAVLTPNDRSAQRPPPLCSIARTRPSSELLEGSKETFLDQQPAGAAKMQSKRSAECCFKFPNANSPDVHEPKRKFITILLTGGLLAYASSSAIGTVRTKRRSLSYGYGPSDTTDARSGSYALPGWVSSHEKPPRFSSMGSRDKGDGCRDAPYRGPGCCPGDL